MVALAYLKSNMTWHPAAILVMRMTRQQRNGADKGSNRNAAKVESGGAGTLN